MLYYICRLRTSAVKKTEISEPISLEVYRAIAAYKKIAKNETDLKAGELIEVSEKNEKGESEAILILLAG